MPTKAAGVAAVMAAAAVLSISTGQDPSVAQGKKVFEGKAGGAICFTCHGMNGKGMPGLGPDLTDDKWLWGDGSAASIDSIVRAGVPKPKQSAAPMPPLGGGQLNDEMVKAVVAYVRSLKKG